MQKQLAIKLLIIFGITLSLLIPINMVQFKIAERQQYQSEAYASVAQSWTGQQTVVTPILIIPYHLKATSSSGFYNNRQQALSLEETKTKYLAILPDVANTHVTVENSSIYKGIYEIPVYSSLIDIQGSFDNPNIQRRLSEIENLPHFESFEHPILSLYIADMRGIDGIPTVTINSQQRTLEPGSQLQAMPSGLHIKLEQTDLKSKLSYHIKASLRGMESFLVVPLAGQTHTSMDSNWPHPEFTGAFLPNQREISSKGFTAQWQSSRYSINALTSVQKCIEDDSCDALTLDGSGVNFINPVDVYLQTERALKYAILFIGLSFITFFIFEQVIQLPIHPIQYTLVGLAIATFYLLLVSLAEHIPLIVAYFLGVLGCTALIVFYVRYLFRKNFYAYFFGGALTVLYGLLYIIIQAEDYALLMGSLLVFTVLAILMTVTRKIDWYSVSEKTNNRLFK